MIKRKLPIWTGLLAILLLNIVCFSQTDSQSITIEANINCGYADAMFDSFVQNEIAKKTIIIIAYEGVKDSQKGIVVRRLNDAKKHITGYYKESSRLPDKVITAVGTDKDKLEEGKLDFYVDGKLRLIMFFLRNKNFALSSCYESYKE